jgi:hypothetical protein
VALQRSLLNGVMPKPPQGMKLQRRQAHAVAAAASQISGGYLLVDHTVTRAAWLSTRNSLRIAQNPGVHDLARGLEDMVGICSALIIQNYMQP